MVDILLVVIVYGCGQKMKKINIVLGVIFIITKMEKDIGMNDKNKII